MRSAIALLFAQTVGAAYTGSRSKARLQVGTTNCMSQRSRDSGSTLLQVKERNPAAVEAWQKVVDQETRAWTYKKFEQSPKLAFVFMLVDEFPMQEVWRSWLRNADPSKYKLVIHSANILTLREKAAPEFQSAIMNVSTPSKWCAMVPAMLAATRHALADPAVQKIVFFCGKTAPIKSFDYVYDTLLSPSAGVGGRGFLPLSEMCSDEVWHRGMPWSYVFSRADATLFSRAEDALASLYKGIHTCDNEDWFVLAFELARRPYSTSCVTWNGWYSYKEFSKRTNGKLYDKIVGEEPIERRIFGYIKNEATGATYVPSDCMHPLVIVDLPTKVMDDMLTDPDFLFARKFKNTGKVGNTSLIDYVVKAFSEVKKDPVLEKAEAVPVIPHDFKYLWRLWNEKLEEDRSLRR